MRTTRSQRQRSRSERARRTAVVLGVVGSVGLIGTVLALFLLQGGTDSPPDTMSPSAETTAPAPPSTPATSSPDAIEVPDVVGKSLAEAGVILEAAGLTVKLTEDASATADAIGEARTVTGQEPSGGTMLPEGMGVMLVVPAEAGAASAAELSATYTGKVVCIDPGHQSRGDSRPEPIGPGATETKARVTGGTSGVNTRTTEYEVVLQISMNLKARLEAAGVTVVMTRMTNDVSISNSERATTANEAGADLFVRVHADGSTDSSRSGVATLYPGANQWTGGIAEPSTRAARFVQDGLVASTGAADLGITPRTDLSGFNWATVPSILVECGFMTNPVEDRLLSSPHYQDKLAEGMLQGILAYLGE